MPTFEGYGLCEKAEYHAAFERRLQHDQLTTGELYVARFRLESHPQAYRILGRVGIFAMQWSNVAKFDLHLLNNEYNEFDIPPGGSMHGGIFNYDAPTFISVHASTPIRMRDGCLTDYTNEDDFHKELLEMLDQRVQAQL